MFFYYTRYCLLILLILFLSSCNKTPPPPNEFYAGRQNFEGVLLSLGLEGKKDTLIQHQAYSFVSKTWILNTFAPSFIEFERKNNFPSYKEGIWSCGDASDICRQWAKALWISQGYKKPAAAGKFIYYLNSGQAHSIVVFIAGESLNDAHPIFYEPQKKQIITLSDKERQSILWVEF